MDFHKIINVPIEMYGKFGIPPGYTSSHSTVNANVFKFLRISSKFVRSKHRYIYIFLPINSIYTKYVYHIPLIPDPQVTSTIGRAEKAYEEETDA